jgi:peptidoglycan hydrolase CwlO-like protein
MKRLEALVAGAFITGIIALCILAIGVNAALNTNTAPIADSPSDPAPAVASASTDLQAQINQLQNLVQQYQNREKQYQAQLNQSNARLQQYQTLLQDLQRRGIIRINADGSIQLRARGSNQGGDD